jgi:hypothetical protein
MVQIINSLKEFYYLVNTNPFVLIEVYQDSCPACKQVIAFKWLEKLQEEFPFCVFAKTNSMEVITNLKLQHIPSFFLYANKELIHSSYAKLDDLRAMIGRLKDDKTQPLQAEKEILKIFEIDAIIESVVGVAENPDEPFSATIDNLHLGRLTELLCKKAGLGENAYLENKHGFTYYQTIGESNSNKATIGKTRATDSTAKYLALVALENCIFDEITYESGEFMLFDTKHYDFVEAEGVYLAKNLY